MSESVMGVTPVEAATQTITTGGTAQVLFDQNIARKLFIFANTSAEAMFLRFHASLNASPTVGIPVAAGASLVLTGSSCPTSRVTVVSATTSNTFHAAQGPA